MGRCAICLYPYTAAAIAAICRARFIVRRPIAVLYRHPSTAITAEDSLGRIVGTTITAYTPVCHIQLLNSCISLNKAYPTTGDASHPQFELLLSDGSELPLPSPWVDCVNFAPHARQNFAVPGLDSPQEVHRLLFAIISK